MIVIRNDEEMQKWQEELAKKAAVVAFLSNELKDLQITLDLFLREYNAKVGIYYAKLDSLKLKIQEYNYRIEAIEYFGKEFENQDALNKRTETVFAREREYVDKLEKEAFKSAEEYETNLGKKANVDSKIADELKCLYRKLVFKFHPDRAKNDEERKKFHKIMAAINEAYNRGDLAKLKEYIVVMETDDRLAKETPGDRLKRLKEEYAIAVSIIEKLQTETLNLKTSAIFKLYNEVHRAKAKGKDLLENMANDAQKEIAEKDRILQSVLKRYDEAKAKVGWHG